MMKHERIYNEYTVLQYFQVYLNSGFVFHKTNALDH